MKQQQEYQERKSSPLASSSNHEAELKARHDREDEISEKKAKDKAKALEEIKKWRQDYLAQKAAIQKDQLKKRIEEEIQANEEVIQAMQRDQMSEEKKRKN